MQPRVVEMLFVAALAACSAQSSQTAVRSTTTIAASAGAVNEPGIRKAVPANGTQVDRSLATPDGRTRTYRLYIPSSLRPDVPAPLVVALHGGTGSGRQFEANSGFDGLAEANRFIVAYPDGIGIGARSDQLRTWNGGYCCGPAVKQDVDDVGFIRILIDTIERDRRIDAARVYAVGHSNGGILGYRLACELADRIVAVGVQAASLGVDRCRPARPVSLIHLHGTADRNHPIEGGTGDRSIAKVTFRSARWSCETLGSAMGRSRAPLFSTDDRNPDLAITAWTQADGAADIQLVTVSGASHAWMGHGGTAGAERLVGRPYDKLDASYEIWKFLAAHHR